MKSCAPAWCVFLLTLLFSGCSASEEKPDALLVGAAISLKEPLEEIGRRFETETGRRVVFNLSASNLLQRQIETGAPADVFASAATSPMDALETAGLILPQTRKDFASNTLVLIVSVTDTLAIRSFEELKNADIHRIAIGSQDAPVRLYAEETLRHLGLWEMVLPKLVFGQNARQVVEYVARGEADAGLAYRTDAQRNAQIRVLATADTLWHRPIVYPIAVVAGRPYISLAIRFVDFTAGPVGREILARHGFGAPALSP
ncbi:MAG: molybdate ABC transporter substrate-binding protein [candidate division Zixibacteria bacterium]|nr:molybdate ABC transporter substrate-binding protein [candidate division Zixibacteria bacterium]